MRACPSTGETPGSSTTRGSSLAALTERVTRPRTAPAWTGRVPGRASARSGSRSRATWWWRGRSRAPLSREAADVGIDYVVDYDCEPKRALGLDRILELLKDRSRAAATLELLRERGEGD